MNLKVSIIVSFIFYSFPLLAETSLKEIVQRVIKDSGYHNSVEYKQKILRLQRELENTATPMDAKFGLGQSRVGSYVGQYEEMEVGYTFELDGEKRIRKQKILPLEERMIKFQALDELNMARLTVIDLFIQYKIVWVKYEHAKIRKKRLLKLKRYIENMRRQSSQMLVNKEMLLSRLNELELEINVLNKQYAQFKKAIKDVFGQKVLSDLDESLPKDRVYTKIYGKIQKEESNLEQFFKDDLKAQQFESDIAQSSWVPDLTLYAGRNVQEQYGARPQVNTYMGLSFSIPLENLPGKRKSSTKSKLLLKQAQQRFNRLKVENNAMRVESNIKRKIQLIEKYNNKEINRLESKLDLFTKDLAKGLISIQSYLDFEDNIHMKLNQVLDSKLSLFSDFFELVALKKLKMNLVEEL